MRRSCRVSGILYRRAIWRETSQNSLQMSYTTEPASGCLPPYTDEQLTVAIKGATANRRLDQHQLKQSQILISLPIPYHNIPKKRSWKREGREMEADHAPFSLLCWGFVVGFFGPNRGMRKFLGQGSNQHHSSNLSPCSDNTRSLTH